MNDWIWIGALVALLLLIVAGICAGIARRPRTNANSALSLMCVVLALAVATVFAMLPIAFTSIPKDARILLGTFAGALVLALLVAGIVLAILGLIELRNDIKRRYNQGRKQSWTSIGLVLPVLGVMTFAIVGAFSAVDRSLAYPMQPLAARLSAPIAPKPITNTSLGRNTIPFDQFGFRFDAPPYPWVRSDLHNLSKDTCVVFGKNSPPVFFSIIAESMTRELQLDNESLAEAAIINLKNAASSSNVVLRAPAMVDGVPAIRLYSHAELHGTPFTYVHHVLVSGTHAYQLVSWGLVKDEDEVRSSATMMANLFHVNQHDRSAAQNIASDIPLPPFNSQFGYHVIMSEPGWRPWTTMGSEAAEAEYGALNGIHRAFAVVPVVLGDFKLPMPRLAEGLLSRFSLKFSDVTDVNVSTENGVQVMTCAGSRAGEKATFNYRFKLMSNDHVALIAAAWTTDASADASRLAKLLQRVTLDPDARGPEMEKLSAQERKTRGLIFNEIGLSFYEQHQMTEASKYLEVARAMDDNDPIVTKNLVMAYMASGDLAKAAPIAIAAGDRFPDRVWFRTKAAYCCRELGQTEQAIKQYQELFSAGLQDDAALREYATLLVNEQRIDDALSIVLAYQKKFDTIPVTLLLGDLYYRKGDLDHAVTLVKERQTRTGFNSELAVAQVEFCLELSRYQEMLDVIKLLHDRGNDTPHITYLLGQAQLGMKWYREAKESFEAVLARQPNHAAAKEMLATVSGLLGEGENSSLKVAIEPVAIPDAVLHPTTLPAVKLDEDSSAIYLNKLTAISYVRDKEFRTTEYRHVKVLDQHGVEGFSTMQFLFDPLSEQVYVNKVEVRDSQGKVVSSGKVADYFTLDQSAEEAASQRKVLHVPIGGLRPGYTFEMMMTRREFAAPKEFRWTQHGFSGICPAQQSALVLRGDVAEVTQRLSCGAPAAKQIDGATCWIMNGPQVLRREPLQKLPSTYLPQVVLADKKATWESQAREYLKQIETHLAPDPAVTKLATTLTANCKTEPEKIAAICKHMQQEYIYKAVEFGRRARIPQPCTSVMEHHFGDCKDHALLLHHLFNAAGIPAHLALVRSDDDVIAESPSLDQFDHMIVFVPPAQPNQRPRFYDCTDKGSDLRPGLAYLWTDKALVLDPAQPRLVDLPPLGSVPDTIECTRDVQLTEAGDVAVKEVIRSTGYDAASLRAMLQTIEPAQRAQSIQKMLMSRAGDMVVSETNIRQFEDNEQSLVIEVNYTMKGRFNALRQQLIGALPAPWARYLLTAEHVEKRRSPFEIRIPMDLRFNTLVHLPAGYQLAAAPQARKFDDVFSTGTISYAQDGANLKIDMMLRQNPGDHPASAYTKFQQTEAEILSALEQNVVLEKQNPP